MNIHTKCWSALALMTVVTVAAPLMTAEADVIDNNLTISSKIVTPNPGNDLGINIGSGLGATYELATIPVGSTTTVNMEIVDNDTNGCSVSGANPLSVTISRGNPSSGFLTDLTTIFGATVTAASPVLTSSPSTTLTFTSCGVTQPLVISAAATAYKATTFVFTGSDSRCATGTTCALTGRFVAVTTPALPSDSTSPLIVPTVTGTAGANGWYTSDVTVSWTVTDDESTISSTTGCDTTTITTDASSVTLACSATSTGGTASESVTIKRDATAPTVSLVGGPDAGGSYYFGSVPATPTCTASDAVSLLAAPCAVSGYSAAVGSHTVTGSATDNAGNSSSATASYTVLGWTRSGFYAPVDMGGTVNTVKGGSTVPLKFEIFAGTTELTNTSAITGFVAKQITCATLTTVQDDLEVVTTGGTSLRYDATGGQFIQNWQTPKSSGKCYVVTMTTQDGGTIVANFKTK